LQITLDFRPGPVTEVVVVFRSTIAANLIFDVKYKETVYKAILSIIDFALNSQ